MARPEMKEMIDCPVADCEASMRYDVDDKEYTCNNCGTRMRPVNVNWKNPNADEDVFVTAKR